MTSAPGNTDTPALIPAPDWIISDTHFGHEQILEYCPWRQTWARSVAEHDAHLIAAWQGCVRASDIVLHLGDFALGPKDRIPVLRAQLPGRIILIHGNHDRSCASMQAAGFDTVASAARIVTKDGVWIARHNPAAFSVREAAEAVRLLHGHSHGNGLAAHIHASIAAKVRDCSLDARRVAGPVPWDSIR